MRDVTLPIAADLFDTMFGPIVTSEIQATYATEWKSRPDAFSKAFAATFGEPAPSPDEVSRAREARAAFERSVSALFADVDVLAMPTVPLVAPPIDGPIDGLRILRNTWPFNAARGPAISVPCGAVAADLPVGLQLVAERFAETTLAARRRRRGVTRTRAAQPTTRTGAAVYNTRRERTPGVTSSTPASP